VIARAPTLPRCAAGEGGGKYPTVKPPPVSKALARAAYPAPVMTRRLLPIAAALAVILAVPAQAAGPVSRSDPQHLPPLPPGGVDLPLAPPVVRFPLPPQWVTMRSEQDWRTAGRIDPELSAACSARTFRQQEPLRFRAIFKGEVLGVAFGHGLNLHDPKKLADRQKIYLFRNGDTSGCVVVVMDNGDPRVLDPQAGAGRR